MGPLRAELLGLRTTRLPAVGAAALALVVVAAAVASDRVAVAYAACFVAMALGAAATAWECRDGALTHALLASPSRWPVAAAKLASHLGLGAALGLLALGLALLVTGNDTTWAAGYGAVPAAALAGALGVAAGLLVREAQLAVLAGTTALALAGAAARVGGLTAALVLGVLVVLSCAAGIANLVRRDIA